VSGKRVLGHAGKTLEGVFSPLANNKPVAIAPAKPYGTELNMIRVEPHAAARAFHGVEAPFAITAKAA